MPAKSYFCALRPAFLSPVRAIVVLLTLTASLAATEIPRVSKIEPPNWWIGYVSPVMVLLYGENLAGAKLAVEYPGARLEKSQVQPDGKHAFLWIRLSPKVKPGNLAIQASTSAGKADVSLLLQSRPSPQGKYQGISADDVIYLIMPDRFADGLVDNNRPKNAPAGTFDRGAPRAYHGGDLRGIRDHLPYLKELGVTAIWTTPLYENAPTSSDYHGYGAVDEYAVDPHLGSMQDFQELVAAAHQVGIKVLLDMVPNHVGPKHPWATSQPAPGWLHGTTEYHLDTDYDYPPITDPHATPANYVKALEGWFANALPDLAQENPLVAQWLLQNALWWTESGGVDGFRIDTFPYVIRSFWQFYHQGLFSTYPHFFTVGEVYNPDPTVTSYWAGGQKGFDGIDTGLTTPFDFPMDQALREVVGHGAPVKKIVEVLRQDRLFPHPELLVTFIGNHDMPRFLTEAGGSPQKLKLAFSLLATLRGIPQLYAGDEIGMEGGGDPDNRRDFPGGFPGDAKNAFTAQGRTPEQQDVFTYVQTMLRLRATHSALREGRQWHIAWDDNYYAFVREDAKEKLLVVFNNAAAAREVALTMADTPLNGVHELERIEGEARAQVKEHAVLVSMPATSLSVYKLK